MPDVSLDTVVRASGDCMMRELDGEAVILNLASSTYFGLDLVGTRIWQLLEQHGRLSDVLAVLKTEYDAPPDALERDLLRLVSELVQRGLVVQAG